MASPVRDITKETIDEHRARRDAAARIEKSLFSYDTLDKMSRTFKEFSSIFLLIAVLVGVASLIVWARFKKIEIARGLAIGAGSCVAASLLCALGEYWSKTRKEEIGSAGQTRALCDETIRKLESGEMRVTA